MGISCGFDLSLVKILSLFYLLSCIRSSLKLSLLCCGRSCLAPVSHSGRIIIILAILLALICQPMVLIPLKRLVLQISGIIIMESYLQLLILIMKSFALILSVDYQIVQFSKADILGHLFQTQSN